MKTAITLLFVLIMSVSGFGQKRPVRPLEKPAPNPEITEMNPSDISQFIGLWENVDPETRGILRIELIREGDAVAAQIYGKCTPTPCVWKKSYAVIYASDVESDLLSQVKALSLVYDQGFAQTIVTVRRIEKNKLQAEVFTRFTDRSKRTNTFNTYTFDLIKTRS